MNEWILGEDQLFFLADDDWKILWRKKFARVGFVWSNFSLCLLVVDATIVDDEVYIYI